MAILQETTGQTLACDGCGRTDAGPGQELHVKTYVIYDANVGSDMSRQFCGGCAANRNLVGDPTVS
ncbi:MAG TPA: hypothetical protein VFB50_05655 [Chloroflexota bacterium]|nr:hypothetical protein [Chloroflexota bacterium]